MPSSSSSAARSTGHQDRQREQRPRDPALASCNGASGTNPRRWRSRGAPPRGGRRPRADRQRGARRGAVVGAQPPGRLAPARAPLGAQAADARRGRRGRRHGARARCGGRRGRAARPDQPGAVLPALPLLPRRRALAVPPLPGARRARRRHERRVRDRAGAQPPPDPRRLELRRGERVRPRLRHRLAHARDEGPAAARRVGADLGRRRRRRERRARDLPGRRRARDRDLRRATPSCSARSRSVPTRPSTTRATTSPTRCAR